RRRLWPWAVVAAGAALAAPSAALAQIIEIGDLGTEVTPSCPSSPCLAVNGTTGYQAKVGTRRGLMKVPRDGRIVAWTVRLAKPGPRQIALFNQQQRGPPRAPPPTPRPGTKPRARAVAQGEAQQLEPYFGTTVQFALERSIPVKKN